MIQTQTQLNKFLNSIKHVTELVIDTEFKRTNTYYPKLCLIQIATNSNIACIDVLAIEDLAGLSAKLYQAQNLWIMHSASQDIEALYCVFKKLPTQLFDTQIAAALSGYPINVSYQDLTKSLQNINLKKAYTRFNWTTRPLPAMAIEYAVDDVLYLLKNYQYLAAKLTSDNKFSWVIEESKMLLNKELYDFEYTLAWKKIKGLSNLSKNTQILAAQLAAWREYRAQQNNKPRKWIITDKELIAYAQDRAKLSLKMQKNFANFMDKYQSVNTITPNIIKVAPPTKNEKILLVRLQKFIQQKAKKHNLAIEIIASKKLLLKYIRGNCTTKILPKWRFDILQECLAAVTKI